MRARQARNRLSPSVDPGSPGSVWRRPLAATAWILAALATLAAVAGALVGSTASAQRTSVAASPRQATPVTGPPQSGPRPNIVFVLTDDLSRDLVRFMPHVQALAARGMSFSNYFVSDSLCCPSRASIFTGNFPHDTGVFTNVGSDGGFSVFHARGEESSMFSVALQKSGYQTAMMGKYLNGYLQGRARTGVANTYVPPGWNEWDVAGFGYPEYDYPLNENGVVHRFGHRPRAYLTDVLARRGTSFVDRATASGQPFFLELATFAPHAPYTPARRNIHDFPGLTAPRPPNFDALPTGAPQWLANHPPLSAGKITRINRAFRRRAQSVQAVDDMIGRIEAELVATGQSRNTYFVFSSDNGYHTGEYRLMPGKLTAFNTDIRVPLVVSGPGVPAGTRTAAITQNIDLAETFAAMGGATLSGDGHSLMPLLTGQSVPGWRNAALVEHHGPDFSLNDPDRQTGLSGNPTTYEALRTPDYLYVEYRDDEREFYDLRSDPFQLDNRVASLTQPQLGQLHTELARLEGCHTSTACWAASHVPPLGPL